MATLYNSLPNGRRSNDGPKPPLAWVDGENHVNLHGNCAGEEKVVPIAIIGMSFKFPDSATSGESFWSMMMDGRCASSLFPPDRLDGASIFHPDPNRSDSVTSPFLTFSIHLHSGVGAY
jgi:hypothetical protein